MWEFFAAHHNWFIAAAAFLFWGGYIVWYFVPIIRKARRERTAQFFRNDW